MNGSERILFVSNFSCLCHGMGDATKNSLVSQWQMKRVVVTEQKIYFFPHSSFESFQAHNQKEQPNDIFEEWSGQLHNSNTPAYQTVPYMMEKMQNHRKAVIQDRDSITSPPLLIHPCAERAIYLLSIESLLALFSKMIVVVPPPFNVGRGIAILNKNTREINYLTSKSFNDAYRFVRACNVANMFTTYFQFCQAKGHDPNQQILDWLQQSVNVSVPVLNMTYNQMNSLEKELYETLLESSPFIGGINIQFSLTSIEEVQYLQSVLTSKIRNDQLLHLIISNTQLTTVNLERFYNIISFNQYLEFLDLSHNHLDDKGIELVARTFEHCIDLKRINLSNNQIKGVDVGFETFLIKATQLLTKIKLDLSNNQLIDSSIPSIEARVLLDDQNQIEHLNISYNQFSRQGAWRLFMGYTEGKKSQPNLIFQCFPLPLSVEIFTNIPNNIINFTNFNEPIFFGEGQLFSKIVIQHDQTLNIQRDQKLPLYLPKKTLCLLKNQKKDINDFRGEMALTIARKFTNKMPVTERKVLQLIKNYQKRLDDLFETHKGDPPIEDVHLICLGINDFPYQVPLKMISRLQEWVWHKLNEAILIRDHYSISFLAYSAFYLEMDTDYFKDRFLRVTNRKQQLEERIQKFLNFEVPEPLINKELDDLLMECHRLDIRGFPLDALILIKIERDIMIRQLALNGFNWNQEWILDPLQDAFTFIDRDLDKLDINLPRQLRETEINLNLFIHPQRINYFELCFVRLEKYQLYEEKLMKILGKENSLDDREMISQFAIDEFRKEDHLLIRWFGEWGFKRIQFIVDHQYIKYNYIQWKNIREDIQMNSVRMAVYYFNYKQRRKEIYAEIQEIHQPFEDMDFEDILSMIDRQDTSLTKFKELEETRFLLSDLGVKRKVKIKIILQYLQINIYTKNPELPINLHEYIVNNDILIFEHLRKPSENLVTKVSTIKKDISKIEHPDSILIWVNNPNISTLQRIDDEVYVHAVYEMEKSLRYIYRELAVLDSEQYETSLAFQSMMHIIDICQRSPEPCLLADELYLQIFRYQNKLEIQDGHFAGENQLYKVISVFTLYIPPSRNLQPYMLAWLYQKSLRFQLQKPVKKALQHLITWDEIYQDQTRKNKSPYLMPDWLPDIYEIKQRFRCNPTIELNIKTCDNQVHSIIVPEFANVGEVMDTIYKSELLGGIDDKYSYWIYREIQKEIIYDQNGNEVPICDDIPLLHEEGIIEAISKSKVKAPLILKRRIFCAWYSLSNEIIRGQHFNLFFHELARAYLTKDYLYQQYEKESQISLASILYIIFTKEEINRKAQEIIKQSKRGNEEELKQKIIHETITSNLEEKNIRNRIKEFLPIITRHLIPLNEIHRISSIIIKDFYAQSLEDLKEVFVAIMRLNQCAQGTCFRVKAFEAFQVTSSIRTDALMIVSTFGIQFFEWRGALQKAYKVYMYEEIIGFSITTNQMRLHVTNQDKQYRIVLIFQQDRALECYIDIISYMILRTNEYLRPLYAYNELFRMTAKENIFLNENPNRNRTIQYVLGELAKKESQQHSSSSFFNQVSKVTKRQQLQEQMNQVNHIYQQDERFIQLLIRKQQLLISESAKVNLNTLMFRHFPFHLECPLINSVKDRTNKQIDVSKYFKNPRMVTELYDPKREKFGKAIIPYDISSDTSNPKEIKSDAKSKDPGSEKADNKGDQSSKSKQSNRMLSKYSDINDDLLNELHQNNIKFKNITDQSQNITGRSQDLVQNEKSNEEKTAPQEQSFYDLVSKFNKANQPLTQTQRNDQQKQKNVSPISKDIDKPIDKSMINNNSQWNEPIEQNKEKPKTDEQEKPTDSNREGASVSPSPVKQEQKPKQIKFVKGIQPQKQQIKDTSADDQLKDLFDKYKKLTKDPEEQKTEQNSPMKQTSKNQPPIKQNQQKSPIATPPGDKSSSSGTSQPKKAVFIKPVIGRKSPEQSEASGAANQNQEPKKVPISFKKPSVKPPLNDQLEKNKDEKEILKSEEKEPIKEQQQDKMQEKAPEQGNQKDVSGQLQPPEEVKKPELTKAVNSALKRFPGKQGKSQEKQDKQPDENVQQIESQKNIQEEIEKQQQNPFEEKKQQDLSTINQQNKSPVNSDGQSQSSRSTNRKGPPRVVKQKKF